MSDLQISDRIGGLCEKIHKSSPSVRLPTDADYKIQLNTRILYYKKLLEQNYKFVIKNCHGCSSADPDRILGIICNRLSE